VTSKRAPSHPIPDTEESTTNLADSVFVPLDGYTICQWHRLPDGKGSPEAICLNLATTAAFIVKTAHDLMNKHVDPNAQVDMVLRVKSREEANRLINVLTMHADEVWPVQ